MHHFKNKYENYFRSMPCLFPWGLTRTLPLCVACSIYVTNPWFNDKNNIRWKVHCGILLSLESKQSKKFVLKHPNKTYSLKNRDEILEVVVSCISLSLFPLTANYRTWFKSRWNKGEASLTEHQNSTIRSRILTNKNIIWKCK